MEIQTIRFGICHFAWLRWERVLLSRMYRKGAGMLQVIIPRCTFAALMARPLRGLLHYRDTTQMLARDIYDVLCISNTTQMLRRDIYDVLCITNNLSGHLLPVDT